MTEYTYQGHKDTVTYLAIMMAFKELTTGKVID